MSVTKARSFTNPIAVWAEVLFDDVEPMSLITNSRSDLAVIIVVVVNPIYVPPKIPYHS
jgi:hypothetical protein